MQRLQNVFICLAVLFIFLPAQAAFVDASVIPRESHRLTRADYRLWIPEKTRTIRALIVRQHGCGTGATVYGLTHAHDPHWQALAAKHDCALLATRLVPKQECGDWYNLDGGSGELLLQALTLLARKSGHPEIETAPWVLCGHSGGAWWTGNMLAKYPERILAAVPGRIIIRSNIIEGVTNVPVLYALGAKDNLVLRQRSSYPPFVQPPGGSWCYAIEPTSGHELGNMRLMAIPWIEEMLTARLPARGTKLKNLNPASGWYGDNETHEIAPAAKFTGDKTKASWLPNERLARRWKEYVTTGTIASTQKPNTPTQVSLRQLPGNVPELEWQHLPDLDAELPHFRIYRDGQDVGTVSPPRRGHGDNPEPVFHRWSFRDSGLESQSKPVYHVTAFQGEIESPKSREANLVKFEPRPPVPDLVVLSITPEPANPKAGDTCTFRAVIKNQGATPTPPDTLIGITFSVDNGRVGWGDTNVVLLPGESVTVVCQGAPNEKVWTAKPGKHTLSAMLDDVQRIRESDKSNNRFTTEIEVPKS